MAFTAKDVQKLREQTGAGMMDCKKALTSSDGDFEKANSQFRIALKVMDAFKEDFIENKWFKATVYEYTNEQRKEIETLLTE